MPYGYEPINYIPDYSFVAKAGQQLGSAVQDFSNQWSAHKKEEETLRNNRTAADDFYSSLKSQGTQALIDMGFSPEDAEARMQNIKPLSDAELQNPTVGWERIKNDFAMISKGGEKAMQKRGQEELDTQFTTQRTLPENRSMPLTNAMPIDESGNEQFGPPKPVGGETMPLDANGNEQFGPPNPADRELPFRPEQMGPAVPTLTPPPTSREELYSRKLSPQAREAAKTDARVALLPESPQAMKRQEVEDRQKVASADKTEAEADLLRNKKDQPPKTDWQGANYHQRVAEFEETKRTNRIKDLDLLIKAKKAELDSQYGGLPEDENNIPMKTDTGIPFFPWDNKKVEDLPIGYKDVNSYKGDIRKANTLRKELATLEHERLALAQGSSSSGGGGGGAYRPGAKPPNVEKGAYGGSNPPVAGRPGQNPPAGGSGDPDVAQAKRLMSMQGDGKGGVNKHYNPNPTPADIQAMVTRIKLAREKKNTLAQG